MLPTRSSITARPRGFTLLELILVMSVMLMLVGIGVGSFALLEQEDPLQGHVDALNKLSRQAMQDAVMKHQSMQIVFDRDGFSLGGGQSHQHGRDVKVFIKRWMSRQWQKAEGEVWHFGEQGICEPLAVRLEMSEADGDPSVREVKFHALTGALTR